MLVSRLHRQAYIATNSGTATVVILSIACFGWPEGPCLVHTITGDLLRALEAPDHCQCPRLISVSSEGHCIIYYERGRFCNFSINGKLLAQMEVNDSTRVR